MNSDSNLSELKNSIRERWDANQNYDSGHAHGVNSETEKELWGNGISELVGNNPDIKILDIGTGTGFLALLLGGMGYDITAVDWSMTMMQKAKEKASAAKIPIKFEVQDVENLTFSDDSFDAIVSRACPVDADGTIESIKGMGSSNQAWRDGNSRHSTPGIGFRKASLR